MAPQTLLVVFLGVAVIVEGGVFPLTSPDNKIHTGTVTDISKFPWMVAILRNDLQHCGGVIISQDWILTAAHCTKGVSKSELKLRVGSTRYATGGQEYLVDKVVEHPEYDPQFAHNDISVVKTSRPIALGGPSVAAVKLPPTTSTPAPAPSTTLTVSGWGKTELHKPSDTLKAAKVVVTDFQRCVEAAPKSQFDETSQICAEFGDGIPCRGDSGSAVVMDDVLVGVVSLGFPITENRHVDECTGTGPVVFTRVSYYRDWIRQLTNA